MSAYRHGGRLASTVLLVVVLVPWLARGQSHATTADLAGVVIDETQAVLPGAAITATHNDTGVVRRTVTDERGRFSLPALPVGEYSLRAERDGFRPRLVESLVLTLGGRVELTLPMVLAGTEATVTVTVDQPIVDVQQTVISSVMTSQQIETLPINRRDFLAFSVITPAVNADRTPQQGASRTSGLTFGGQRGRSNSILVDGLDNNDEVVGSVRATFSQEAVREFQVLTHSYAAEFGKASGGVVNIVTRSGTNDFSAGGFFFGRERALNARGHFEKFDPAGTTIAIEKAPFNQKQYGATAGGPLRRNASFFFVSFERLDVATSNQVTIDDRTIVPHPLVPDLTLGTPAQILRSAGFPVETGNVPYVIESNQFLGKIDQQLGAANRLTLRLSAADEWNENIEPFGGLVARSRAAVLDSRDLMFAAALTMVPSGSLVNELRFQVASRSQDVLSLDPTCPGACTREDQGGPTLEVTGFASVGRHRFTPTPRDTVRYQLLNTFSYYRGDHQVKAGVDVNFIDGRRQALPLHFGGRYIFARELVLPLVPGRPPVPVSSIQAVALGLPAAYVQGYGNSGEADNYQDISLFVQDTWRIRPTLNVNAGLRYQRQFWPDTPRTVPGYPGSYAFPDDTNNLAPRLGVAWNPAGDGRTSIHGAYGVFYDHTITSVAGITDFFGRADGVRTLVLPAPGAFAAWAAPERRLDEGTAIALLGRPFPSLTIAIDPRLKTAFAHHVSGGIHRELPGGVGLSANVIFTRGFNQLGTIDYNPIVPELGAVPGVGFVRRPGDIDGIPGTSASVLQYTAYGETWYRGVTLSAARRFDGRFQILTSYTLSKAEDNSTDFQSAFVPEYMGKGRNPVDPDGLPIDFNPDAERGPSLQDQRHRFVLSGLYVAPGDVQVSTIAVIASGRPHNILAGADLNSDGNGGAFPPDRARREPSDPSTSVRRNAGTLPLQATVDVRIARQFKATGAVTVDALFEVFNLFNRTNFTEINEIFGVGPYPTAPVPTYGQFTQAGAPRQAQLGVKVRF